MHERLAEKIRSAYENKQSLRLVGGDSKAFYGRQIECDETLCLSDYRGIVSYEPTELVVTAKCGTPLIELENILSAQGQMLPFEPPHFSENATVGGTIACGLSGPMRAYTGSVRDYVLGVRCINGKGEVLTFGGQVMKNVAGFDISRLMVGALGTLGAILEVSFKLLPLAEETITLQQTMDKADALAVMNGFKAQPLPVSAACYYEGVLMFRLSGVSAALLAARDKVGGERVENAEAFWQALREHRLDFFLCDQPLFRLSVPPATPLMNIDGEELIDWGGAQRWLKTDWPLEKVRTVVEAAGGHVTAFRNHGDRSDVFTPLSPALQIIHQRLKHSFDPHAILNPGRMYQEL